MLLYVINNVSIVPPRRGGGVEKFPSGRIPVERDKIRIHLLHTFTHKRPQVVVDKRVNPPLLSHQTANLTSLVRRKLKRNGIVSSGIVSSMAVAQL